MKFEYQSLCYVLLTLFLIRNSDLPISQPKNLVWVEFMLAKHAQGVGFTKEVKPNTMKKREPNVNGVEKGRPRNSINHFPLFIISLILFACIKH